MWVLKGTTGSTLPAGPMVPRRSQPASWTHRVPRVEWEKPTVLSGWKSCWKKKVKINMEDNKEGLEDDFPLQIGDFSGSMPIFRGVSLRK